MINKKTYKIIKSLKNRKFRYAQKRFIVEGLRLIKTILENGGFLETVLFTKAFKAKNLEFINQIDSDMLFDVSEKEMKDLSNMITPSGILAISKFPIYEKLNSSNNIVFFGPDIRPWQYGHYFTNSVLVWY